MTIYLQEVAVEVDFFVRRLIGDFPAESEPVCVCRTSTGDRG